MIGGLEIAAGGIIAAIAAIVVAFFKGRSSAVKEAEASAKEEYIETRKKIDEAGSPNDPSSARDWLRNRGKQ